MGKNSKTEEDGLGPSKMEENSLKKPETVFI
jgi:hypothetical protein